MREERQSYRVELPARHALTAELELFGARRRSHCRLTSVSLGGAGAVLERGSQAFLVGQRVVLHVALPTARHQCGFHALVRYARSSEDALRLGLQFVETADRTADGLRDELLRELVMELQRESLARRSGVVSRRAR